MKRFTLIEWLVVLAILAIFVAVIGGVMKGIPSTIVAPDGKFMHRVQIDGHDYIKSGDTLTHSASCAACLQKEK